MALPKSRIRFQNPAGQLVEHPKGEYLVVRYATGPRHLADLQTLLGQAKQILALRDWHKLIGDQRHMAPFTPAEAAWVTDCWLNLPHPRRRAFYGAVLLLPEVFLRLPSKQALAEATAEALTYRLFGDEQQAISWLAQLPESDRLKSVIKRGKLRTKK